ncbi:MAG: hypothetical protein K6T16_01810 [Candidatus Pacearchaeota archaeon]|nr:hypothetical protein [Candidatus Pacearchaeota archaeon]
MDKKAQVTLFIVIAIILVALIVLVIIFQQGIPGAGLSESDVAKVKSYLGDCFELKTQEAVLFIARQGGYYSLDNVESINFLDEKTAYYWKGNQTFVPSANTVAGELAKYLDEHSSECFASEELSGYAFEGKCLSDVEISEKVSVLFNCPVTVKKGTASSRLENFNVQLDAPVLKFLDVSSQVVEEYKKATGSICMTCIEEIASEGNVTIRIVPVKKEIAEPEHIWFLITDKNIKFDGNITWRFVTEL